MTRTCIAYKCSSCASKESKAKRVTFHYIPKDRSRRLKWLKNMGRTNYHYTKQDSLCSLHFLPECMKTGGKCTTLKKDALPTIFKFPPHKFPPKQQKMRRKLERRYDFQPPETAQAIDEDKRLEESRTVHGLQHDHASYALPNDLDQLKKDLVYWREKAVKAQGQIKALRVKVYRRTMTIESLREHLQNMKHEKVLTEAVAYALEKTFAGNTHWQGPPMGCPLQPSLLRPSPGGVQTETLDVFEDMFEDTYTGT